MRQMTLFMSNVVLLCTMLTSGLNAQDSVEVYSQEGSGDDVWVRPKIQIKNAGTQDLDLSEITVNYYFYEVDGDGERIDPSRFESSVWYFDKGGNSDVVITFSSFDPPFESEPKKANLECNITFSSSIILTPDQLAEVHFGFHETNWIPFTKSQHYSFIDTTVYTLNAQIVVIGPGGSTSGMGPGSGSGAPATEPNYVRTTVYDVNRAGNDVVTTEYTDGLGRGIQSRLKLDQNKERATATFYDDAGRPYLTTKPFVDQSTGFNPGGLSDIISLLDNSVNYAEYKVSGPNTAYAYYETEYYNDPLSRVKRTGTPGNNYRLGSDNEPRYWYFGVNTTVGGTPIPFDDKTVTIEDGFIKEFTPPGNWFDLLGEFYEFSLSNPIENATHYLTVTMDPNKNITQELKDLFGRTVATHSSVEHVSGNRDVIAKYEYDILGNVLKESAPEEPGKELDHGTYQYNTLGQLIYKKSPDGAIERMEYNDAGYLSKKSFYFFYGIEVLIRILSYTYDDLGRLTKIIEEPLSSAQPIIHTQYFYDNTDELVDNIDRYKVPRYHVLNSLDNLHGRIVASVSSNIINGKPHYVTDLHSYDDEGRIKIKYKVIPGLPFQKITYEYDIHGKLLKETFNAGEEHTAKHYAYNSFGQLKKTAHTNDPDDDNAIYNNDKEIADYIYDNFGRISKKYFSKLSPLPDDVTYEYTIREWLSGIDYSGCGPNYFKENIEYANGSYNENITDITAIYKDAGSPDEKEFNHYYVYDELNRLTYVLTEDKDKYKVDEFEAEYSYDKIGRFKTKQEGASIHDDYQYYEGTNRLKSSKTDNGGLYLYDEYGNMIIDENKKMFVIYDWRNMPVQFSFYSELPVGDGSDDKIQPGDKGTVIIHDTFEGELDEYIDWLTRTGQIELLSRVNMLYDASGRRVLKTSMGN